MKIKSINEIGKAWRFCGYGIFEPEYIEIDEHANNFHLSDKADKSPVYAKIHLDANDRRYIWYKRHTYYIDVVDIDPVAQEIIDNGNYDSAVALMDDEIREAVHADLAPCSDAEFLTEYMKRHAEKYGEEFCV